MVINRSSSKQLNVSVNGQRLFNKSVERIKKVEFFLIRTFGRVRTTKKGQMDGVKIRHHMPGPVK
jgi:hypothetical protein